MHPVSGKDASLHDNFCVSVLSSIFGWAALVIFYYLLPRSGFFESTLSDDNDKPQRVADVYTNSNALQALSVIRPRVNSCAIDPNAFYQL